MKVSSSSIVRCALAAWASASPLLAAPAQSPGAALDVRTAVTSLTPGSVPQGKALKSMVPVAPPNPIPISSLPITITQPGYYRVTKDLVGVAGQNGITVDVDNVVVDLAGFTLTGVIGSSHGIFGASRLTVLNGRISLWGGSGVSSAATTELYDLILDSSSGSGASVSTNSLVQDCEIGLNGVNGISGGTSLTVIDCLVVFNGADGVHALGDCLVQDSFVSNNGDDGMELHERSRVMGCHVVGNDSSGIEAKDRAQVSDTTAVGNSTGFVLGASSRIERCVAHDNGSGILADDGCHVVDCTATSNAVQGIAALEGSLIERCIVRTNQNGVVLSQQGCRISDCRIEDSVSDGLFVSGSTTVERNSVQGSGSRGIVASSGGNRIDGNDLADNGVGIAVLSSNNLIVRNTLTSNGAQMQIAPDNMQGPFIKTKGFIQDTNPWANFDLSFPASFP